MAGRGGAQRVSHVEGVRHEGRGAALGCAGRNDPSCGGMTWATHKRRWRCTAGICRTVSPKEARPPARSFAAGGGHAGFPRCARKVPPRSPRQIWPRGGDTRLLTVSGSSVVRSQSLHNVWTVARDEWGWCGESPWPKLKDACGGFARTRRAGWREVRLLLRAWRGTGIAPVRAQDQVHGPTLGATRTALRCGRGDGPWAGQPLILLRRVVTLHTKTMEREACAWICLQGPQGVLRVLDVAALAKLGGMGTSRSAATRWTCGSDGRGIGLLTDLHF